MNACTRSTRRLNPLRVTAVLTTLALFSGLLSGCSSLPAPTPFPAPSAPHAAGSAAPRVFKTLVMLHGEPLELHVGVAEPQSVPDTLVLYASGDGGWFGAAVDMFKQIAGAGYPVVGFSSKAFLKIQRPHGRLVNAAQLAADYEAIVTQARAVLHQTESSRVVFTGWSRGAAFAVLAGSEPTVRDHLAGVIAIGLGPGEDLLAVSDDEATDDDGQPGEPERPWRFDTYASIARLEPAACAVIQASHDSYLPAAAARRLLGPDTDRRRLYAIDARNHRFTGGKAAFDAALIDALHWIVSQPAPAATSTLPPASAAPATPSVPAQRNS